MSEQLSTAFPASPRTTLSFSLDEWFLFSLLNSPKLAGYRRLCPTWIIALAKALFVRKTSAALLFPPEVLISVEFECLCATLVIIVFTINCGTLREFAVEKSAWDVELLQDLCGEKILSSRWFLIKALKTRALPNTKILILHALKNVKCCLKFDGVLTNQG